MIRAALWRGTLWRQLPPGPVRAVLAFGIAAGGVGGAYPDAFLGEQVPPGLVAGALLGIVGAGVLSFIWAVPLGAMVSAGDSSSAVRMVRFAQGASQARVRGQELGGLGLLTVTVTVAGAGGGMASVLAQVTTEGGGLAWGLRFAPGVLPVLGAMAASLGAVALGWLLGISLTAAPRAILVYLGALCLTVLLAGSAYFSPAFVWVTAAAPGALVIAAMRNELLAPQFSPDLPLIAVVASSVVWALLLALSVAKRLRAQVR